MLKSALRSSALSGSTSFITHTKVYRVLSDRDLITRVHFLVVIHRHCGQMSVFRTLGKKRGRLLSEFAFFGHFWAAFIST